DRDRVASPSLLDELVDDRETDFTAEDEGGRVLLPMTFEEIQGRFHAEPAHQLADLAGRRRRGRMRAIRFGTGEAAGHVHQVRAGTALARRAESGELVVAPHVPLEMRVEEEERPPADHFILPPRLLSGGLEGPVAGLHPTFQRLADVPL